MTAEVLGWLWLWLVASTLVAALAAIWILARAIGRVIERWEALGRMRD
jgi:hypothetical protein